MPKLKLYEYEISRHLRRQERNFPKTGFTKFLGINNSNERAMQSRHLSGRV